MLALPTYSIWEKYRKPNGNFFYMGHVLLSDRDSLYVICGTDTRHLGRVFRPSKGLSDH